MLVPSVAGHEALTSLHIMINIGIVDDHPVVRAGLREFLDAHADLHVVGEATSGWGAIDLVNRVELDVLVLDLMMAGQSGQDALTWRPISAAAVTTECSKRQQ